MARQLGTVPHARWWFLLAVVLLGVGSYATVLVPQLMGQVVDLVTGNGATKPMWRIGTELVVLSVAGAALSAAGFYLVARLSERVIANLRQDMVGTALGLPTHQVEDAGTGDLVSRSTDDVAELSAAVTETLPTLSTSLFSIIATRDSAADPGLVLRAHPGRGRAGVLRRRADVPGPGAAALCRRTRRDG